MADHLDGPRAFADPPIDITDVFAFPSPKRPGYWTFIINVFPFAGTSAFFSDGVKYKLRIRPAKIRATGPKAAFDIGEKEYLFTFTFKPPRKLFFSQQLWQEGSCILPTGEKISFQVHDRTGVEAKGVRLFAGLRLDPFFMDAKAIIITERTGKMVFQPQSQNSIENANVLSIILEVETAKLFASEDGMLWAIAAETETGGKIPACLDRFGRPEITNITMGNKAFDSINHDLEIRDLYNQEDSFNLSPYYIGAYRSRINANLAHWDKIDGKTDWPLDEQGNHPLTELLLADFMIADFSKPYSENSYFEIEQSMLKGVEHQTCGGRTPNDDVIDTILTLYITGGNGDRIRDGVDRATQLAGDTFPYLKEPSSTPNPGPGKMI